MPYTVTLNALRTAEVFHTAHNMLVQHITGEEVGHIDTHYIQCDHNEPITMETVINVCGLVDAVIALQAVTVTPEFTNRVCKYASEVLICISEDLSENALRGVQPHLANLIGILGNTDINTPKEASRDTIKTQTDQVHEICWNEESPQSAHSDLSAMQKILYIANASVHTNSHIDHMLDAVDWWDYRPKTTAELTKKFIELFC